MRLNYKVYGKGGEGTNWYLQLLTDTVGALEAILLKDCGKRKN
jgi:hypothetical protein